MLARELSKQPLVSRDDTGQSIASHAHRVQVRIRRRRKELVSEVVDVAHADEQCGFAVDGSRAKAPQSTGFGTTSTRGSPRPSSFSARWRAGVTIKSSLRSISRRRRARTGG